MSNDTAAAERLLELESRLTWQDDTIDQLNEVVRAQWDKIDQLSTRIEQLEHRLREVEDRGGPAQITPPPHY